MEDKVKFIIIGLVGLLLAIGFLFAQTYNYKEQVLRERDALKSENSTLMSKADKIGTSLRAKENEASSLRKDLDKITRAFSDLQSKFDLARRERDKLAEELKSSRSHPAAAVAQQVEAPVNSDAYWGGVLKAKTDLELQLENLRKDLKNAQSNNEQLQREKVALDIDINSMKGQNEDLKRQLEYDKKVADSIAEELAREKNDKINIQKAFKAARDETVLMARQIRNLNTRKSELDNKVNQLYEDREALQSKLSEIEFKLGSKVSQVGELKDQLAAISSGSGQPKAQPSRKEAPVELSPIVVRPQMQAQPQSRPGAQAPTPDISGKILTIDRENNFVIIDLGAETGLKIGNSLNVYRDGKKIAALEVIKASKSVAACDIIQETIPVGNGDMVK